jgi:hypothetical protein
MPDHTDRLLPHLLEGDLEGVDLGQEAILPAYDGYSILNVPSSLCKWLGVPPLGHPGIRLPALDDLARDAQQILLVLIDGLGWDSYRNWQRDMPGHLDAGRDEVILAPLTSVVPSTTSSALTTLWTGSSPAEHGFLGYELFLKEVGMVTNMVTFSPMYLGASVDLLASAGIQPGVMLPVRKLGEHLKGAGVEAHAFIEQALARSPLSRMHFKEVDVHGYLGLPDLWTSVAELMQNPAGGRRFIWVYFGTVDALGHRFGPASRQAHAAFQAIVQSVGKFLSEDLPSAGKAGTLLLLLADHGQIHTPDDPRFDLAHHSSLTRRLHMLPTGEHRLAYFHVQPAQTEAVREYVHRTWPGRFQLIPSSYALHQGLFGPGEPDVRSLERMGDWVAVASDEAYFWWAPGENKLRGRHGGVTRQEMLVPLLAARLG